MGGKKDSRILPDFVYMTKPTRGPGACAINSAFLFLIVRRTIRFFVVKNTSQKNALSSVYDLGEKMEALMQNPIRIEIIVHRSCERPRKLFLK